MASGVGRASSAPVLRGRETTYTIAVTGSSQLARILEENANSKDPILGFHVAFETIDSAYEKITLPLVNRVFALGNTTCEKIHKIVLNFRKILFRTNLAQDSRAVPKAMTSEEEKGVLTISSSLPGRVGKEAPFEICQKKIEELRDVCSEFISEYDEQGEMDRVVRKFILNVLTIASGYYKKQNTASEFRKIEAIEKEVIECAYDELSPEVLEKAFHLNRASGEKIYRAINSFRRNAVEIDGIFDACAPFLSAYGNNRLENEKFVRKCVLGMLGKARAFFEAQNMWVQLVQFEQIEKEVIEFAFKRFLPLVLHADYQEDNRFVYKTSRQFWNELSETYFKKGANDRLSENAIELSASNFPVVFRICRKFIEQFADVIIPMPEKNRDVADLKNAEFQKRFQAAHITQNGITRRFIENILNIAAAYYKGVEDREADLRQLDEAKAIADKMVKIEKMILEKLTSEEEGEASYGEVILGFEDEIFKILKPKEEAVLNLSAVLNAYENTQPENPESNEGLDENSQSEPTALPPRSVLSIAVEDSDRMKIIQATFDKFSESALYEPSCGTKALIRKVIFHFRKDLSSRYLHSATKLKNSQASARLCKKFVPNIYDICLDWEDQFNEILIPRRELEVLNGRKEKAEFEKRYRMAIMTRNGIVWRWALAIFDQAREFYGERWVQVIGEIIGIRAGEKDVEALRRDAHKIDITQERERRKNLS